MRRARKLPLKDAWAIWFLLGVVMLNYPFMDIFNKSILILGIPLPVLYFFIGWPISIFVVYLFSIYLERDSGPPLPEQDQQTRSQRKPE